MFDPRLPILGLWLWGKILLGGGEGKRTSTYRVLFGAYSHEHACHKGFGGRQHMCLGAYGFSSRPSPPRPRCAVAGVTHSHSVCAETAYLLRASSPLHPQPQRISKQQMIESFQRDLSSFIYCREGHERPQARAWPRDTSGSDILIWYQQDVNVFKSPIAKFVFEYVPHRGKAGSVSLTRAFALF